MNNIPAGATKVVFKSLEGKTYKYYIWKRETDWVWYSTGQTGTAPTQEQAMFDARHWVTLGVAGIPRRKTGDA